MDPTKVQAVTDWPVPDSRLALQRFLGFTNFYRRFFRTFSQVATPLTGLMSAKSRFVWSEAAQCVLSAFYAFESLKRLFASTPILISPDPESQFIVEVLSSAECNYNVGNQELRLALEEWHHWLEGTSSLFIVWTDHRNLEYIRSAKRLNSRQARWALFQAFQFQYLLSARVKKH